MKLRLGKRIAAVCLSFVMLVAACFTAGLSTAVPVQASTEKEVTLGAGVLAAGCNDWDAAKVWYGYNDTNANKDRYVWRVVGYNLNDNGVAAEVGKMTLLADESIMLGINYDTDRDSNLYRGINHYGGSTLENIVDEIAGGLSGSEQSAVSKRTLIGGSANKDESGYDPDHISGDTVQNALMWPLSAAEANTLSDDLSDLEGDDWDKCWWLRSPGLHTDKAQYVSYDGHVTENGDVSDQYFGVRPAFHLDLSSVIFSSLLSGTAGTPDAEYKLTLKQDGNSMQIATNGDPSLNGKTITVPYNITGSRSANRVSVMITDKAYTASDARILQYGKLNVSGTFGSAGTGTFTIDNSKVSGIWGTGFHVYILAEEVHLGNDIRKTDYASEPVELTGSGLTGEHIHGFTYTQSTDGHSIDAVCTANGCTTTPVPNASLTILAPALTSYGGTQSPEATLSGIEDFNAVTSLNISGGDILYQGRNNTSYVDTVAPVYAGDYTASITVNGITASVDYSIAQIPITITAASGTWEYDGTAHTNTAVEVTPENLVTGDTLVAEASGSVTNVSDTADGNNPVAAGYKIMRGTDDVTASYNITTVPGKLTITPLSVSGAAVTLNSSQLQYNETEQTVGISSVVANGTTLTEGVDYTVSGNKATNIGNYTVTITGTNNCIGSVTAAWSIIEPANNTPVYVPSTPDPEPTPVSDGDTQTYNNPDGSVTTKTTNRHDNGSVTVEEKTEFEDGSYTLVSETKDKDGNLISRTDETKTISKKGTAVVTTKTVNANGSTLEKVVKTTKKGRTETSSVATQATKKGNTIVTVSMTDSDGYELSMGFTVKKGVVTLTSFEASESLITIPDEITANGVTIPVAAILKGTFKNNTTIINVTIGRNVTVIGSKAFYGAKNLKSILVYGDLEKVGKGAFKGIAKDALIKIKADKENYNRIVELIKASGIGKNVKFKRIK